MDFWTEQFTYLGVEYTAVEETEGAAVARNELVRSSGRVLEDGRVELHRIPPVELAVVARSVFAKGCAEPAGEAVVSNWPSRLVRHLYARIAQERGDPKVPQSGAPGSTG